MKQDPILAPLEKTLWTRFRSSSIDADFVHIAVDEAYDDFLLHHAEAADDMAQVTKYVKHVAYNKIVDELRRHNRLSPLGADEDFAKSSDEIVSEDAMMDIETLISQLPPKQAEVIRMKEIEGRLETEIATTVGITTRAVRMRLHTAWENLHKMIK